MTEKRVALIIASYQYEDADLRRLVAPAQDAEALARVLADPTIGGFEVETLLNEPSYKVNRAIEAFFADRKRNDLLLLYFSGHGIKDEGGRLYFATTDTGRRLLRATAIPATLVNDVMRYSRSRRQVLLLDCCYSGAFARGMVPRADKDIGTREHFEGRGRVVLTASDAMQYAFEGDDVRGEGVRSVFTHTLVRGLETGEADLDGNGHISLDELYDYVFDRITDETPQQRPGKWAFDVQGEIIVARNPNPIVKVAELPSELQQDIEDPRPWVREGAVRELGRLLYGSHKGLAQAAYVALTRMSDDDSRLVSGLAADILAKYEAERKAKGETERKAKEEAERKAEEEAVPFLRKWWRWLALALSTFALIIMAVAVWFPLPPRFDPSIGDIFWADDHLLWAKGSQLVSVPASASRPPYLVVEGRKGNIQVVGQDAMRQLWVGLAGDGLDYQQGEEWTRYVFEGGAEANTVQAIAFNRYGGVWIGTRDGAALFDGEEWTFYTSADGLSSNNIRAITVTRDDTVWFGTWRDGLTSWRGDQVMAYRFGLDKKWNRITALRSLGEDLWVGTEAGLIQLSPPETQAKYTHADGLPGDFVTALATDPDGRLWIGTWGGGVGVIDETKIVSHISKSKKFNYVVDLVVGGNKVWVMSPEGIMVFDLETEVWTV